MVELALTVPILLALLFGIFEFGKLFDYKIQMTQQAREGARQAVVNVNPGDYTPSGSDNTLPAWVKQGFDTGELRNDVQVCIAANPSDIGDPVTVTVRLANYPVLPFLEILGGNLGAITIESEVQMRLEQQITLGAEAAKLLGCTP